MNEEDPAVEIETIDIRLVAKRPEIEFCAFVHEKSNRQLNLLSGMQLF